MSLTMQPNKENGNLKCGQQASPVIKPRSRNNLFYEYFYFKK